MERSGQVRAGGSGSSGIVVQYRYEVGEESQASLERVYVLSFKMIFIIRLLMKCFVCMGVGKHREVRRQLAGTGSLLPPDGI